MVRIPHLLGLSLLVMLLPVPSGAGDPGGGDAPGDMGAALPLPLGSYDGEIGDGDQADWYLVSAPADIGVGATLRILNEPHVHIAMQVNGKPWTYREHHVSPWCCAEPPEGEPEPDPYAYGGIGIPVPAGGDVVFGVLLREPADVHEYTFDLYYGGLSDLAITEVQIEDAPIQTEAGPVPASIGKRITMRVQNLDPDSGSDWAGVSLNTHTRTDDRWTFVGGDGLQVTPGYDGTFTIDWSRLGYLGDVALHLDVGTQFDVDQGNNHVVVDTFVGVGGAGFGVSPLARDHNGVGVDQCRGVEQAGVCIHAGVGAHGADVGMDAGTPDGGFGVGLQYSPWHGGGVDVCTYSPDGGECTHQGLP